MNRTPAFTRAVALAEASGAAMHIGLFAYHETLEALGQLDPERTRQAREAFLAGHEQWLAGQVAGLLDQGLRVTSEVVCSEHPAEDICARALPADLLIKDVQPPEDTQLAIATPLDLQLLPASAAGDGRQQPRRAGQHHRRDALPPAVQPACRPPAVTLARCSRRR